MTPVLVINPRSDEEFVALVHALVLDVTSPAELEQALHASHPNAVVHRRELEGERTDVWYVYRDGHWIPPSSGGGWRRRAERQV